MAPNSFAITQLSFGRIFDPSLAQRGAVVIETVRAGVVQW